MENDRRQTIEDQVDDAYRRLRGTILDPIIEQLISAKKGKANPHAFMGTPEAAELLIRYKRALYDFIDLDGTRHGICINLAYGSWTGVGSGISMIALSLSNEFIFHSEILSSLSVILVVLATIFLTAFVINYRKQNSAYQDKLRKLRMST